MNAALAYTAAVLVLLGCGICFRPVTAARRAVLRARWAWRCRGTPVPADGEKLTREETQALGNLDAGRDVRTRT